MSAYNFTIKQGETFQSSVTYKDSAGAAVDIGNYEACMQIRKTFAGDAILQLSHSTGETVALTGDLTGSAFISISGSYPFTTSTASGVFGLYIGYSASAQLTPGDYVYDLEVTNTETYERVRLLQGKIKIDNEVTTIEPQ